ncbi:hypothetical protein QP228_008895 [Pseudoglutamicibacter cumminsii]|nr:hypothetical protein [Pseudoglutamicibacter cumminsii]MDZ3746084.1 hypothetical protein [Pseudoglutamicibacter cumminsii]
MSPESRVCGENGSHDELLHSDEVKQFIEENWKDGTVIPAF